jgi:hypothetical protein
MFSSCRDCDERAMVQFELYIFASRFCGNPILKIATMGEPSVRSCFLFVGGMFEATHRARSEFRNGNKDLPIGII